MKRYIPSSEQRITHEGNVGIWRFINDKLEVERCALDKAIDNNGILCLRNSSDWCVSSDVVTGAVFYDCRCQYYEITCNKEIADNSDLVKRIADLFNIIDLRYEVALGD